MTAIADTNVSKIFDDYHAEYRAAKETRFQSRVTGISRGGSGADYHYHSELDFLFMIERARHYFRNDMIVGQGIRRLVANVIQDGFQPDPQTRSPDLNKALKDAWWQWAMDSDACHSEGEMQFPEIEQLTLQSAITDGDVFALFRDDGSIQPIEAHRPRTPRRTQKNVVHGVLLDENARRKEVWISKEDIGYYQSISKVSEVEPYKFRNELGQRVVAQVYLPDRFSQRRGVTALAPPSECIGMHGDLQFATMVKAQLAALLVFLREQHKDVVGNNSGPPIGTLQQSGIQAQPGGVYPVPGLQTGIDYLAPPGQTLKGFTANIPNPEFFPHTMMLLTFIAINLDMPVQMLLLDPDKSNFSAWRGAVDQARMRFRKIQSSVINRFHLPVWKWKVQQFANDSSALRKMIGNDPTWMNVIFSRPKFTYIDPLKDAQADAVQSEKFLNSHRRIQAALNRDWDEVLEEIVEDRVKLITRAVEAAKKLQTLAPDVTWRDVLSATLNSQVQQSVQPQADESDESEDKPAKKSKK